MTDDHDWVARLLASTTSPGIPDDVALRLDRALRDAAVPARADDPAGPATPADDRAVDPPTPADDRAVVPPADIGAVVPPAAAGAVPPPASTSATGALPRLRSLSTGVDSTDDQPSSRPASRRDGSSRPASRPGGSRREQRQDDQGDRRRRLLTRWAPVAAGVLVLGGAAVVGSTLVGGGDTATMESAADDAAAGAAAESAVAPRALVATGTQYSTADVPAFEAQVRELVAAVAAGAAAEASAPSAAASPPSADASSPTDTAVQAPAEASAGSDAGTARADTSPLADPQVLADCVSAVTQGATETAAAVDLAVVDGLASTLLVVPDAAGLSYQVYVVGEECGDLDTRFDFFVVTP